MSLKRYPWAILAMAACAISSPASAQFEIVYPDEPANEGQILIKGGCGEDLGLTHSKHGDLQLRVALRSLLGVSETPWPLLHRRVLHRDGPVWLFADRLF